jgi:hypothetical protein
MEDWYSGYKHEIHGLSFALGCAEISFSQFKVSCEHGDKPSGSGATELVSYGSLQFI